MRNEDEVDGEVEVAALTGHVLIGWIGLAGQGKHMTSHADLDQS